MKRIIFIPQFPVKLRYSEWWLSEFEEKFKKYYDEVIVLGKSNLKYFESNTIKDNFAPIDISIKFELVQIQEFLDLELRFDDTLFLSDISFPGLFSNTLHHKKVRNSYAFCHGTSKNAYDYFQNNRDSKWLVESGHSKLFKKVFVATNYHKQKLGWKNIEVIGVPKHQFKNFNNEKEYDIISVCRDSIQKRNRRLEKNIEKRFGNITTEKFDNWNDYYQFISKSKIMIITAKEETFGYQVLDSISNNCIPLAPNKFSYPELLDKRFLYNDENNLIKKINYYLNNWNTNIELINQSTINNFYDNLISLFNN